MVSLCYIVIGFSLQKHLRTSLEIYIHTALGFAAVTATFLPRPNQSAYDYLNQIERLFTKHLTNLPAYNTQGQRPATQNDVAFWCVKP